MPRWRNPVPRRPGTSILSLSRGNSAEFPWPRKMQKHFSLVAKKKGSWAPKEKSYGICDAINLGFRNR